MSKPSVIFAAAECAPFVKVGGLADVAGALPMELVRLGHDCRVALPYHQSIKDSGRWTPDFICGVDFPFSGKTVRADIYSLFREGVTHYLIDNPEYFGGEIYASGDMAFLQYAFFCKAVLEALPKLGFIPDIIHANDWHTGLIPLLAATQYAKTPLGEAKLLFTSHNMIYQGDFPANMFRDALGIGWEYLSPDCMGTGGGRASFMKAAMSVSHSINTVSPTYAREILTPEFGMGLEGLLNKRRDVLSGIINGVDTLLFDPEHDRDIAAPYSARFPLGKELCRSELRAELGFDSDPEAPLIAMVTRMTWQKGMDFVIDALDGMLADNTRFVILGNGQTEYEDFMREAERRFPGRVRAVIAYEEALAHRIYAGADIFLMPSRFEPCGLSQMIAMRYGTLPVVRRTGGLADSVPAFDGAEGCGFLFTEPEELPRAMKAAVAAWRVPESRGRMIRNAMSLDVSFAASAREYSRLYESMNK